VVNETFGGHRDKQEGPVARFSWLYGVLAGSGCYPLAIEILMDRVPFKWSCPHCRQTAEINHGDFAENSWPISTKAPAERCSCVGGTRRRLP
jgi:hypothetical protein